MDRKGWFLSGLLTCLSVMPLSGVAQGQAIDWRADALDVALERGQGTARLDGMGELLLSVADEERELNLHDYGRNLAGTLWDADASRIDLWFRSTDHVIDDRDAQRTRTRTRVETGEFGTSFDWRVNPKRMLGVDFAYERLGDDVERGDNSLIRNPNLAFFGMQQIGYFVLGGAIGLVNDSQSLNSSDIFAVRHKSSGTRYLGSMAYRRGPITAGLQIESQVNTIDGLSYDESKFHEDEMTWKRPVEVYSGSLFWEANQWITGSLRGEVKRIDAREDAQVSWSDRMPDNPGRAGVLLDVGTFEEKVSRSIVGSRWDVRPTDLLRLGVDAEIGQLDQEVNEGVNFKGSRRAQDSKRTWARLGMGGGYQLADGKLQIGADAWYLRANDEQSLAGQSPKIKDRTVELRLGAEWFVAEALALRGGYLRTAADSDLDQPQSLLKGNGLTLGVGYLPRGGLYQINAAFKVQSLTPDYQGEPSTEEANTAFSLAARFLL
jgi:hypothetical protein